MESGGVEGAESMCRFVYMIFQPLTRPYIPGRVLLSRVQRAKKLGHVQAMHPRALHQAQLLWQQAVKVIGQYAQAETLWAALCSQQARHHRVPTVVMS